MTTQVKVPDFMLKAVQKKRIALYGPLSGWSDAFCVEILEATLRALMENPIMLTHEMHEKLITEFPPNGFLKDYGFSQICDSLQRIMFLTPTDPRRDKIRRILHTFGILSEDEKIDAILSAFEEGEEK